MRMRRDSKITLLKAVPLFERLSARDLASVASIADEVELKEGKELTREGERGREFFVLLDGTAEVRRKGRRVNTLERGDFLGEIALLTHSPRTATVTATSPVRALVITGPAFRGLLRRSPQLQIKVLEAVAERLAPDLV